MKLIIKGDLSTPRGRITAMEVSASTISKAANVDPADAVFSLLVAAVHISFIYGRAPVADLPLIMANALGQAIACADEMFGLSKEREAANDG